MLPLTLACWDYDRTRAVADGTVRPDGIALNYLNLPVEETFFRMARFREFDACEMSMSSYTVTLGSDDPPFIAIPVFPSRFFRHSSIYVSAASGITEPGQLKGKRVGVPEYQMTAPVWIRGILSDEHGVAADSVEYFSGGEEEPGRVDKLRTDLPPNIHITPIGPGKTLARMLADGEIDALHTARAPSTFYSEPDRVRRLFPDFVDRERDYFRRTRIFPIMHVIAIRRALWKDNPVDRAEPVQGLRRQPEDHLRRPARDGGAEDHAAMADLRRGGDQAGDGRRLVALRPAAQPARAGNVPALPPRAGPVQAVDHARGNVRPANAGELPDLARAPPPSPAGRGPG